MVQDSKNFCCLLCRQGPLSATLVLNQSGYAPGETMRVTAEVDNKSNVSIDVVEVGPQDKQKHHQTEQP